MPNCEVLEPAIDPNNKISFLLDWELTMKCNLDCSYCRSGLYDGHDNSTKHPPVEECLKSLDFMFDYVDLYMKYKPKGLKSVILNIYGGESLHHPNILKILHSIQEKYQPYANRWHLTVTTTTNAVISAKKLQYILPYIDEFTVSYHTENTEKQKQNFKENLLTIKQSGKRIKCVVLMHTESNKFDDAQLMIEWLNNNNIDCLPRQLDQWHTNDLTYNETQIKWFNSLYQSKTQGTYSDLKVEKDVNLTSVGRACCGGRQMCSDENYKNRNFYVVDNVFDNWYCSVNWFFLYIKQVTNEVFVNKDCKMNFKGTTGPIGYLNNTQQILDVLSHQLDNRALPVIQCKKPVCACGLCAPKASTNQRYQQIISKYQKDY